MLTAAPARTRAGSGAGPAETDGVRGDIQALRAIAVASVMLYHLWHNRLTGGYVGVDVFFAISGYLITSHLVGEIDRTGRLAPARFWARRAKRLVPASTMTLLLSAVGVIVWVPHYLWHQFLTEVTASTLQVENWLLAHNSVDYLAANNVASPTQHFWTLGAEEQFYVALPLVLLAAVAVSRLLRVGHRRVITIALVVVVAASFGYSVWLTATTPGVAYFSTLTRAWEFGLGSLLALRRTTPRGRHGAPASRMRDVVPWLGVAAILTACFGFTASTAFPGYAAALPVLATVAVIATGRDSSFARLGRFGPVALLGRISYAAYLWHWPLIVLLPYAMHRPLDAQMKVGIIVATLVIAWASTTFVEDPIRFGPRLLGRRRPRFVAACAAAAMAVVLAVSIGGTHVQADRNLRLAQAVRQVVAQMPTCLGAQALDPALAPCENPALDGTLVPDPAQAKSDDANLAACWGQSAGGAAKVCHLGPQTGYVKRLFAIGDSHNNTLIGVYRQIAAQNDWAIDVAGNAGCYLTTVQQLQPSVGATEGCDEWRRSVISDAGLGGYDAIIVTHSDHDHIAIPGPGETVEQATVRGLVQAWGQLPPVPIIAIRDNPSMPDTTMTCVTDNRATAATACAVPRTQAIGFDGQAQAVEQVPRAHLVDMTAFYCTSTSCAPVIGHVLVYRDASHLTATYATTLEPYLDHAVVAALTG